MWTLDQPWERPVDSAEIKPEQVLYQYDGPTIFTAKLGLSNVLFLKIEEYDSSDLFLAAVTNSKTINLLKMGKLSVYGAMLADLYWLIEVDNKLTPLRYWECAPSDLPDDFLPMRGLALFAHLGRAPDSIEQAEGFFTIAFRGKHMTASEMPFSVFKNLVNNAYDAVRRVLSPIMLIGTKSSTFDFTISPPRFGSLIISIEAPLVNEEWVADKSKGEDKLLDDLQGQIAQQRVDFFNKLKPVVLEADQGEISRDFDADDRAAIEPLRHVIPHDEGEITDIEISASFGEKTSTLYINRSIGGRLHRAFDRSEAKAIYIKGVVTEVNAERGTFRVKTISQRQITCWLDRHWFDEVHSDGRLNTGVQVGLTGMLERRKRIDLLRLERPVVIL